MKNTIPRRGIFEKTMHNKMRAGLLRYIFILAFATLVSFPMITIYAGGSEADVTLGPSPKIVEQPRERTVIIPKQDVVAITGLTSNLQIGSKGNQVILYTRIP